MNTSLQAKIKKVKEEKKTQLAELLAAQKKAKGLNMRLREVHQRNKDLDDDLYRVKDM